MPVDQPPSHARALAAAAANAAILVVAGWLWMLIAFFIAYAFEESLSLVNHVMFLGLVGLAAVTVGVLLGLLDTAILEVRLRQGIVFGVLTSIAAHLLAVALGTLVSFAFESQGSVTADQPQAPFIALVVAALVGSVLSMRTALRSVRPSFPVISVGRRITSDDVADLIDE